LFSGQLYTYIRLAAGAANLLLIPGLICLATGILFIAIFCMIGKVTKQRPQKVSVESKGGAGAWRTTGLIVNIAVPVLCLALLFINYKYAMITIN